jgi:hypothetical protein
MSSELATKQEQLPEEILSKIVLAGDLSGLSPAQKVTYYQRFCERLGLDPATNPFKIMVLDGKHVMYADRGCAAQLCKLHDVSHKIVSRETIGKTYIVVAQASTPDGRQTESLGAVPLEAAERKWDASKGKMIPTGNYKDLTGEALCNAFMKAETKAKRRATLDLVGLGILDADEAEAVREMETEPQPEAKKASIANWREHKWTPKYGKSSDGNLEYHGLSLGEIHDKDPEGFAYWVKNFSPKPVRGKVSMVDTELREALDMARAQMPADVTPAPTQEPKQATPAPEPKPVTPAAPQDDPRALTKEEILEDIQAKCTKAKILPDYILKKSIAHRAIPSETKSLGQLSTDVLLKIAENFGWFEKAYAKENAAP